MVMTMGGLRGAVAFYLALNVSSEYKHLIITTTISLILFTVIGMGSATPLFLKWLDKKFPQDKILNKPDEEKDPLVENDANNPENQYEMSSLDQRKSLGMFSRAEDFEQNYFQKYLRKNVWNMGEEADKQNGIEVTYQDVEKRLTNKIGDLSPNRKSNLVNQEMKSRLVSSVKRKTMEKNMSDMENKKESGTKSILKGNLSQDDSRLLFYKLF